MAVIDQLLAVCRHELRMIGQQFAGGLLTRFFWAVLFATIALWLPYLIGDYWLQQPAFLIIYPLLASTLCIQTIVDAVAGERERHTLESLLATPLSESAFVIGKIAATVSVAALLSLGCILAGILTVNLLSDQARWLWPAPADLLGVVALSVLCPLTISCAGFLASVRARTVRQGLQAYAASLAVLPLGAGAAWLLFPEPSALLAERWLGLPATTRWLWVSLVLALVSGVLMATACRLMRRPSLFGDRPASTAPGWLASAAILGLAMIPLLRGWGERPGSPPVEAMAEHWTATVEHRGQLLPVDLRLMDSEQALLGSEAMGIDALASTDLSRDGDSITIDWSQRQTRFLGIRRDDGSLEGVIHGPGGNRVVHFTPLEAAPKPESTSPPRIRESRHRIPTGQLELGCTLSEGIGTMPTAAVVLLTGAGPQDRDHSLFGHKPYRDLAHYLAQGNTRILRCDDRGVGESGGRLEDATTADLAEDARQLLAWLRQRGGDTPVGLLGHSEGGLVALEASPAADFLILLATPASPGREALVQRHRDVLIRNGASTALLRQAEFAEVEIIRILESSPGPTAAQQALNRLFSELQEQGLPTRYARSGLDYPYTSAAVERYLDKGLRWWRFALAYDPGPRLRQLNIPVLAIMGGLDWQLPLAEPQRLAELLPDHPRSRLQLLADHNHLLQKAVTGSPREYGVLDDSMSAEVMAMIADWLNSPGRRQP